MPLFGGKPSASSALILRDQTQSDDGIMSKAEREKVQAEIEEENLSAMLGIKKPKHIGDGALSGAKCAAGGLVSGAVALVAAPIMSAKAEGAKGLAKGIIQGAASAVLLPAAGVLTGGVQVARGAVNTPFSIAAAARGKQWDSNNREWKYYSLPAEEAEVAAAEVEWNAKLEKRRRLLRPGGAAGQEHTAFYDALGVKPDATAAEIKRSYRELARRMHPDKNTNDPNANAKFQRLGEAYQVLSNEDARAKYDEKGTEGLKSMNLMDPAHFYGMLFGSEAFEDLVGELRISEMMKSMEGGDDPSLTHLTHKQRAREIGCACKLAARLAPYVAGESSLEDFLAAAKEQAAELASTAFGEVLMHTVGYVYAWKATQALSPSFGEAMRQRRHRVGANMKAVSSMVGMLKSGRALSKLPEAEQMEAMGQHMPAFLEAAWHLCTIDVESTLRKACKRVLTDRSVSGEARARRATALKALGQLFNSTVSAEGLDADGKPKSLQARIAEMSAMFGAAPPAGAEGAAAAGGAAASAEAFPLVGKRVVISGLASKPELNGVHGYALAYDAERGRYVVVLDGQTDGQTLLLQPKNLTAGEGEEGAAPPAQPQGADAPTREELGERSLKQLRSLLNAKGVDATGCLEKAEYIEALLASYV